MKFPIQDTFFLSLRMTLATFMFYTSGWLLGMTICVALNFVSDVIMWRIFGLEALSAVDELFILDDAKNVSNVVSK